VVRNRSALIAAPNSFNSAWDGGSDASCAHVRRALGCGARRLAVACARESAAGESPRRRFVEITPSASASRLGGEGRRRARARDPLRSDDTAHGFHIVGTDVDIELPKRGKGVATVMFTPKAGRYTFECSQLCRRGHEFMRGVIVASE
jgi:hypothetical protein